MLYLGIWLFATDNDDDMFSTRIPYGICYLIRLVMVYMIWTERTKMLAERRLSNQEIEKWLRYLGYNKEPKLRPVVV